MRRLFVAMLAGAAMMLGAPMSQGQQQGGQSAQQGQSSQDQMSQGQSAQGQSAQGQASQDQMSQGQSQQGAQRQEERGARFYASSAVVRQVQEALRQQGHDPGAVDGDWGEGTARAVRDFQRAQGMDATGRLDLRTLAALNIDFAQQGGQQGQQQGTQAQSQQGGQSQQQSGGEGSVPIHVTQSDVRQIQQKLSQQGAYQGQVDGQWGEDTANAVREFQRQQNIAPTGRLDMRTISAMGIDQSLRQQGQQQGAQQGQQQGQPQSGQQGQQGQQQ